MTEITRITHMGKLGDIINNVIHYIKKEYPGDYNSNDYDDIVETIYQEISTLYLNTPYLLIRDIVGRLLITNIKLANNIVSC